MRRAEREHGLLGEYHDSLSEGGVTGYSMYDAWEDYRFGVAYSLVGAVAAAGAPGLSPDADPAAWYGFACAAAAHGAMRSRCCGAQGGGARKAAARGGGCQRRRLRCAYGGHMNARQPCRGVLLAAER